MAPAWKGLEWPGYTVAILASGASLTEEQCDAVYDWRQRGADRRVIAINTTFRRALWADVLYACDEPWWRDHDLEVAATFIGARWTQDKKAAAAYGVSMIDSLPLPGLGKTPGLIHQGMNGGYQAINLAYQAGAKRIVLLGYDMHGGHWHGKHPLPLTNTTPELFGRWLKLFGPLAADLQAEGVEVVNCSPGTALDAFPLMPLAAALPR